MNGWIHVGEMPMALCIGKLPGLDDSRTASETPLATAHVQLHCATVLRALKTKLQRCHLVLAVNKAPHWDSSYFHIPEAQPFTVNIPETFSIDFTGKQFQ